MKKIILLSFSIIMVIGMTITACFDSSGKSQEQIVEDACAVVVGCGYEETQSGCEDMINGWYEVELAQGCESEINTWIACVGDELEMVCTSPEEVCITEYNAVDQCKNNVRTGLIQNYCTWAVNCFPGETEMEECTSFLETEYEFNGDCDDEFTSLIVCTTGTSCDAIDPCPVLESAYGNCTGDK
ncbi:hypothetical protein ACFL20_08915 [Spirochaetota bacterium]